MKIKRRDLILCLLLLFSHPVMSDSLWPHGLQHARPFCPSPSPEVCPSSCPLHPVMPSSYLIFDTLFSFCPQSFPASETFPMSWLFASDDQNTGVSASASGLPTSIEVWFPLRLTGLILLFKGLSRVFSNNHSSKASVLWRLALFMVQLSHPYLTTGKNIALTRWVGATDKISCLPMAVIWFAKSPRSWSFGLKCKMGSRYKCTSGVDV